MWRRREILRFKNETNLQPQIPKQIYKSNAEKGSQHNISVQKKLILWDSLTKTLSVSGCSKTQVKLQNRKRLTNLENGCGGRDREEVWEGHVHTAIFKMDNQQGPTEQQMELCSML